MKFKELIKDYMRLIKYYPGKKYYSETGEDAVIAQLIRSKTGRFIDVGASHPIIGNNTFALYRKGWRGIAIEPQERFKPVWSLCRSLDTFYLAVVSESVSSIPFMQFENSLLSTTSEKVARAHRERGLQSVETIKTTVQLRNLLPESLSPSEDYLLSIDVEGAELEVLATVDFIRQRPRIILIESWSLPWEKKSSAIKFLEKVANYRLFAYTGLTAIFIPAEIMDEVRGLRAKLESYG